MSRNAVAKLALAIIFMLGAALLWSLFYEAVVVARFKPGLTAEGIDRWAILKQQSAGKSLSGLMIAAKHFWSRIWFADTQLETAIRGLIALALVTVSGVALKIASLALRRPMPYGNARLGSLADAEKHRLTPNNGLVLGKLSGATLRSNDPAHVLVVGPTRSGKGVSFVVPNGLTWEGSAIWFDPKRENMNLFAGRRMELGDKVYNFAPGQTASHRYNPLDFVRRDESMSTDCLVVSSFIVPNEEKTIWGRSARLLLASLIGYVVASSKFDGKRHMRSVSSLTTKRDGFLDVLKGIVNSEEGQIPSWITDGINQFIAIEPETRNSVLFNLSEALNPWNSDLIAAATETTDFDIRNFRREKMSLFIGGSIAELNVYRPIVKILIQQIHDQLMQQLPSADEPHQVLMMIDEFRQLGRMDDLIEKLTINAGYGFRVCLILQDLGQLDEIYGKATRVTTVSACQVKLFIRINDQETSEYVQDMLGDTTQQLTTPLIRGNQGIFERRDKNVQYIQRPLLSAQELREMPADQAILLVPNAPGFKLSKILHYKDNPYAKLATSTAFKTIIAPTLKFGSAAAAPAAASQEKSKLNEPAFIVERERAAGTAEPGHAAPATPLPPLQDSSSGMHVPLDDLTPQSKSKWQKKFKPSQALNAPKRTDSNSLADAIGVANFMAGSRANLQARTAQLRDDVKSEFPAASAEIELMIDDLKLGEE